MIAGDRDAGVPLLHRFARHLSKKGWLEVGDRVVVACSGGVDSTVLLHLLRFGAERAAIPDLELHVAHFDHRMRTGSEEDALRVSAMAESWNLAATVGRADMELRSEAEARRERYRFLGDLRARLEARRILTAHHADDQAETILFRIFRGSGLRGLGGIPEEREPGILRPLLPFRKEALEAYAREVGLPVLVDATNRDPRFARNVIRHEILPRAEEAVAAGARDSLLRLGRIAAESEAAWESLLPELLGRVSLERSGSRIVIAREPFLEFHPQVRARILRAFARDLGERLDDAGTRSALEFTRTATSGREWHLSGGIVLTREFDRLVLTREGETAFDAPAPSEPLVLTSPDPGAGSFRVGGRRFTARWGPEAPSDVVWVEPFPVSRLLFPLSLRGWLPGDRMRIRTGRRKLKKLLAEARIPAAERRKLPVLADAGGEILWIPGVEKSMRMREPENFGTKLAEHLLFIGIAEAEDDFGA